jgi:TolB-like protein/predicted secreted protein
VKPYQHFFAELKRRHVFKVAWLYGLVAFGVLQLADIALPRLGLPDWTVTFMLAILLLAFPVALILAWAFEVTPEGVRRTEEASDDEIEAIVAAPATHRWSSGVLALVGIAALVGSTWWLARKTAPEGESRADDPDATALQLALADPAGDERPSIAVLPFADMSPDGDQAYFSDGITEEILNTLARVDELKVAARTSAFAFRDRQMDLRAIGDSLGVDYLIEGSVRKSGNELRITAQLIDAADGTHRWSDSYDRALDDVFAIQTEIAEAIADQLRVPLGLDDPSALVNPTQDLEAYDLYLTARGRLRERGPEVAEAIRLFEAAIARDSNWAPAWAGLAEAREILVWYPEVWSEALPDDPIARDEAWHSGFAARLGPAEQAARRALELDARSASAWTALGSVLRDRRDWAASEEAYLRALQLDSDNSEAIHQYAEMLEATGRIADAVTAARRAAGLDPAPVRRGMYGWMLVVDDRPDEALPILEQAVADADGRLPIIASVIVREHMRAGRVDEAARVARETESPWYTPAFFDAIRSGRPDRAGIRLDPEEWMWFGRPDSAEAALERQSKGVFALDVYAIWLPILDPIRDTPGAREFLRRANLADATLQRTPRSESEARAPGAGG